MTTCDLHLDEWRWDVVFFIAYERDNAVFLCQQLASIGCKDGALRDAYEHLSQGSDKCGLTYSNVEERKSIVAIGRSRSQASMANTIGHELFHVVAHICGKDGIDMQGEEPCYIMGTLCEEIFVKHFLNH